MPPSHRDQDEQPLLHASDHHETDTRFAIDDSLGGGDADDHDAEGSGPSAAPKYPPLPPSYADTIRFDSEAFGSKWNPASWLRLSRTTREHIQACLPRSCHDDRSCADWLSSPFLNLWRCWPTNRFVQASIFVVGLWIIVILTGPSLMRVQPGDAVAGVHQDWNYADVPGTKPTTLKGDGKVVEEAAWALQGCMEQTGPIKRVVCTETSSFLLDPNKAKDSFSSTDSIFVDVDPTRADRDAPAGSVPGTIQFVHEDIPDAAQQDAGKVRVEITARYDQEYKYLFERSLVAKTKRGIFDEGVEILTYAKAGSIEKAPLVYDLKVRIPKNINLPALFCEAGASNIEALFEGEMDPVSRAVRPKRREDRMRRDSALNGSFHFGKFHAKTHLGYVSASNIYAMAEAQLSATLGNIKVRGKLISRHIELRSANGHITLDPESTVEAAIDVLMQTSNGRISVERNASVKGTTVRAETTNGQILAADATLHANHTLSLHSDNGRIQAAVAVHAANVAQLDAPGLEKTPVVTVEATSATGPIELNYKEHEAGVPLHSKAVSELARVEVTHHKEFSGSWDVRGATTSKVRGPGTKPNVEEPGRKRHFVVDGDTFGWINRHAKGRLWWQNDGDEGEGRAPQGARSQVATQLGMALAYFN